MGKRTDISSILIIGAGPIIIGQACEFDYSGAQACKALKQEGYRVILLNSNPATIMTDPEMADATYVEPITVEVLEKIIEKEKPDALLPTMGGQTGLNTAMEAGRRGILKKHGVEMIAAREDVIEKAENREKFRIAMESIGLECPRSRICTTREAAMEALDYVGLPAIIRPSYTLGGEGGGIAYNTEEYREIVTGGLTASPVHEVLVEESVLNWKEYEMEVVRDHNDNCIIICSIENVDPMGIHTGDSITVAPALTLTDKEYQRMRNASIACLREIGVDTGGSNVQFAVDPASGRMVVIEMNPRVSRSSALASKATGFPIAKVAAKLAVGYTLDELDNDITGVTPASFEPTIDYVVTKMPRFAFDKFPETAPALTTSMRSVGEAMAIGRNFRESFQKCLRSLEIDLAGLDEVSIPNIEDGDVRSAILRALAAPRPDRLLMVAQAFRQGISVAEIHRVAHYDPWFLEQIETLVEMENQVRTEGLPTEKRAFLALKRAGFSDMRLAHLSDQSEEDVRARRLETGVTPVFKRIDTCAAEFPSRTPYMYSCYEGDGITPAPCEAEVSDRRKAIILGGGPNRIGQGIEFDYCCVHAAYALKEDDIETIMVNCNPETVSTDYDTSDRLYFEPLTTEDVLAIIRREQENGTLLGVIVQLGGQTPLKLARILEAEGVPILGTEPDAIDLAEDRKRFQDLLHRLDLKQPPNGTAFSLDEARKVADRIGYPVLLRPSYVLGGKAMRITVNEEALVDYMTRAVVASGDNPVLLDRYLKNAIEVDVDALSDGKDVHIAGIMEHVEEAGVHSGDSACSLPPFSLPGSVIAEIRDQTVRLAKTLKVQGLMNIQFAVKDTEIFLLEVNPRASRTVPFVAKATGIPVARIAARIMAGTPLSDFGLQDQAIRHVAVKEAVFPFARFPGTDPMMGPEMKSTGEVMGIDTTFGMAFAKTQLAAGTGVPSEGTLFISIKDEDKPLMLESIRKMADMGFSLLATRGTAAYLQEKGLDATPINKVKQGRPHCVDAIKSDQVQVAFLSTSGNPASISDSYSIRRTALEKGIPHYTTTSGVDAITQAIMALRRESLEVENLQTYCKRIGR